MNKYFKLTHKTLSISLFLIYITQVQAFTVTNIDKNWSTLKHIYIWKDETSQNPDINPSDMGSCWQNTGKQIEKHSNVAWTVEKRIMPTSDSTFCVEAVNGNQKFAINPLNNVYDCEIQLFDTAGGSINPGMARASKSCGYTGRCMDAKPYTYNDRHIKGENGDGTDGFKKNCLPYKIYNP